MMAYTKGPKRWKWGGDGGGGREGGRERAGGEEKAGEGGREEGNKRGGRTGGGVPFISAFGRRREGRLFTSSAILFLQLRIPGRRENGARIS